MIDNLILLPRTFRQCAMKRLYNFLLSLISLSLDDKHIVKCPNVLVWVVSARTLLKIKKGGDITCMWMQLK